MQYNHIERKLCFQDVLPVYKNGDDKYTLSQNGNILITPTAILLEKGTRFPIEEHSNIQENLLLPQENLPLSRTEVADEDINKLPYSAIVSLTRAELFEKNLKTCLNAANEKIKKIAERKAI